MALCASHRDLEEASIHTARCTSSHGTVPMAACALLGRYRRHSVERVAQTELDAVYIVDRR